MVDVYEPEDAILIDKYMELSLWELIARVLNEYIYIYILLKAET